MRSSGLPLVALSLLALCHTALAEEVDLRRAVEMALSNNPQIREARSALEGARGELKSARAGLLPSLRLEGAYVRLKEAKLLPEFVGTPQNPVKIFEVPLAREETYSASLKLEWLLWSGGGIESQVRAAERALEAAEHNLEAVKNQVRFRAEQAYFQALKARALEELAAEVVDLLEVHLRNVRKMFEVGLVPRSDVLRVEVELSNARLNLLRARNGHELALASFRKVLGAQGDVRPSPLVDPPQGVPSDLRGEIELALQRRPELRSLELAMERARELERAAASSTRPALVLSAQLSSQGDEPRLGEDSWSVALGLRWNLFDGGASEGRVEQLRALFRQIQASLEGLRDGVELSVESAYLKLTSALERLQVASREVDKARLEYDMAVKRYRAQVASNVEVLDSQVALKQARTNLIEALYDAWSARSELLYSKGYGGEL